MNIDQEHLCLKYLKISHFIIRQNPGDVFTINAFGCLPLFLICQVKGVKCGVSGGFLVLKQAVVAGYSPVCSKSHVNPDLVYRNLRAQINRSL